MRASRRVCATWSQHVADRRTVTGMYAALVRKGVLHYDATQWAMAEACTPLLTHIRRAMRARCRADAQQQPQLPPSPSPSWWRSRVRRVLHVDGDVSSAAARNKNVNALGDVAGVDSLGSDDDDAAMSSPTSSLAKRGLYVWGDVGTGKTMMLDLFTMCDLPCAHRRAHLHSFMTDLVARLARAERTLGAMRRQPHLLLAPSPHDDDAEGDDDVCAQAEQQQQQQQQWRQQAAQLRRLVDATCSQQQRQQQQQRQAQTHARRGQGWWRWRWWWCGMRGGALRARMQAVATTTQRQTRWPRRAQHAALAQLRPIDVVVDEVLHETPVLCFDEFQTFDVAHAALLASFFRVAFARGLFLLTTSNRAPHELCRVSASFSDFVPVLQAHCHVLHCTGKRDYRRRHPRHEHCHARVFVCPSNRTTVAALVRRVEQCMQPQLQQQEQQADECNDSDGSARHGSACAAGIHDSAPTRNAATTTATLDDDDDDAVVVAAAAFASSLPRTRPATHVWRKAVPLHHHGRCMYVPYSCDEVALFDFADVCGDAQRLASSDFQVLARHYHTVIVVNVPPMQRVSRNAVQQFVLLVDELYQHNVKLLMTTQVPWQQLTTMSDGAADKDSSTNDNNDDSDDSDECKRLQVAGRSNGSSSSSTRRRRRPGRADDDNDDDGGGDDGGATAYYSEGEDERSGYAAVYAFANDEDLVSLRRVHSRLQEMGTSSYLLRDHAHFVVSRYNFDALLHD